MMGPLEPFDQKLGSLRRRRSVKGHEGSRPAERDEIGTPPIRSDRGDLNLVDAAVDGLFETLEVHGWTKPGVSEILTTWEMRFYRAE